MVAIVAVFDLDDIEVVEDEGDSDGEVESVGEVEEEEEMEED